MSAQLRLACLACLLAAALLAPASATGVASPPSFFQHASPPHPAILPLRAPAHLSKRDLDPNLLHEALHLHALSRRQDASRSPSNLTQSSTNANDKLQSIGHLAGAYDVPLNLSSNPAQLVFVQLDTGSSDLWIASTRCDTRQCDDANVLKFDPGRSGSFEPIEVDASARLNLTASSFGGNVTNSNSTAGVGIARRQSGESGGEKAEVPFNIVYSDTTSASGVLAADRISISDLSVARQAFALINATNVTLGAQGISGVLGLGFPRGSVISRSLVGYESQIGDVSTMPFMTSLLQTSNESYPLFGLYLTRSGGRATFGAVDPSILPTPQDRAEVEWYDVYPFPSGDSALAANDTLNVDGPALGPYVQWVLPLSAAGVAGNPVTLTPPYPQQVRQPLALLDSGTSSIVGPAADVAAIFARITNARHVGGGRFVVPCDTTARMYFSFGGRNLTLLPTDYIIGPDAQQPYLCFAWPSVAPPDATGVDWILGTPFLRAVYSVFSIGIDDKEAPKIGLYPLRQPANATASSIVFAPQPTASVQSFVTGQATPINSELPNELVTLTAASVAPYFFANATTTPRVGVLPTKVGAPSTYSALLPSGGVGKARETLPVIASSSTPMPVPHNPAATGANGGGASNAAASPARAAAAGLVGTAAALVVGLLGVLG